MEVSIVEGDLFDQPTECIVNSWNRNIIPQWLLIPHGVSGAAKKRAGKKTFAELASKGHLALGQAVSTSAGELPHRCMIHVASIDLFWRSSEQAIKDSVVNSMKLAHELKLKSIAFPILGSGSGNFPVARAEQIMLEAFRNLDYPIEVTLVRYRNLH